MNNNQLILLTATHRILCFDVTFLELLFVFLSMMRHYNIIATYQMDQADKDKLFQQFYLSKVSNLNLTYTSKYEKVRSFTKGCMLRKGKNLYKTEKSFIEDLQIVMNFDSDSASVVFKQYPEIKYDYQSGNVEANKVKVKCHRCGNFTRVYKFCPKCEEIHYCSEICEFNSKLTHEKQECRIKCYPRLHHAVLIEVHFGTNLGHNIEVYFQHETSAYGLMRGKQIINKLYEFFGSIKQTASLDLSQSTRQNRVEQKLMGYRVELKNSTFIEFLKRNEKQYPTGVLKVDLEDIDSLKRIYEQNDVLEEIELYLLAEGALMTNCAQQIHNNHAHWVYIFRMS